MRIIYYSYWGTYAAYLMASLHVGCYTREVLPSNELISKQLELCHRYGNQFGNLIYVGVDEDLREVYSIGCKRHHGMITRALDNINTIFGINEPIYYVNAKKQEGFIPIYIEKNHYFFSNYNYMVRLFNIWFRKHYKSCLNIVEMEKHYLKDGYNQ